MEIQQQAMLEQFKAQLEAQQERARLDLEQWKAQLDNQTKIQIEHIKRGEIVGPDALGAMLQNQAEVNGQLANSIAEMLQAAVQQIRAPRRIVRDANGRAQGIE